MPPAAKLTVDPQAPWYVWAGAFLENAAKTWGIPAVTVMAGTGLVMYFGYRHGDAFIATTIEASRAQAESSRVVAEAVLELRSLTVQNQGLYRSVVEQQENTNKTLLQMQSQMMEQNKVLQRLVERLDHRPDTTGG
jgi:hypothetical protein